MLNVFLEQIFGVDLEARAKADKKRVPIIISTLLYYLDRSEFRKGMSHFLLLTHYRIPTPRR